MNWTIILIFLEENWGLEDLSDSKVTEGVPGGASDKEPACQCRRLREAGSIPGSGRSPGGGHGNLLQYSCLENPLDRGAWRVTVDRVAKSQAWVKWLSMHARMQGHKADGGGSQSFTQSCLDPSPGVFLLTHYARGARSFNGHRLCGHSSYHQFPLCHLTEPFSCLATPFSLFQRWENSGSSKSTCSNS